MEPRKADFPSINDYEESIYSLARVGFKEEITRALEYSLRKLERKDSKYQQSPLSYASEEGHKRVVYILLDKDADANAIDRSGRTPLLWTVIDRHQAVSLWKISSPSPVLNGAISSSQAYVLSPSIHASRFLLPHQQTCQYARAAKSRQGLHFFVVATREDAADGALQVRR